jgi:hypothetical protein
MQGSNFLVRERKREIPLKGLIKKEADIMREGELKRNELTKVQTRLQ